MIKALCLIFSLFGAPQEAVRVKLPSVEVLEGRIGAVESYCIFKQTKLALQLANREMEAFDVADAVESAIDESDGHPCYLFTPSRFGLYTNAPSMQSRQKIKPLLIKSILADYPEVPEEL